MHHIPLFTVALPLFAVVSLVRAADERPNVILVMTDDQGYGDLSITGNDIVATPNMDRLAQEGAWLQHFYVSPVCTPTRAHLMTGRYAFRTRAIDTYLGRAVMEPEETTLAEMLQAAGYATGIFGKWHLGDHYPTRAIDQGFEEALVHCGGGLRQPSNPPGGERYDDPILYHNGEPQRHEGYCTNIFFDAAIDFVEQKSAANEPFFVYLPTNAPHGPFDEPPTRELMEHFRDRLANDKNPNRAGFYAMIKNVDDNIGRLLAKLAQLKIDEETLVIFLTDNGPAGGGSAGPFRGAKGNVYEGGIRTVCFLRWPGTITAGSTSSFTTAHIDLAPTILDFCGVDAPADVAFDGRSVRPLIAEEGAFKTQGWPDRHLFLQWHRGDVPQRYHHFAAIDPQGQWKLLHRSNAGRHTFQGEPRFELYDLQADIGETNNVAGEQPEIVTRLKQEYDAWFEDVCNTHDPNFGMPPIVIGAEQQPIVVLTPQDKRVDSPDGQGWWAAGHWPVDIRRAGPYTVEVLLTEEVPEASTVELTVEVGSEELRKELTLPRGVDSMAIGDVELPAGGVGKLTARIQGPPKKGRDVYQVTIK